MTKIELRKQWETRISRFKSRNQSGAAWSVTHNMYTSYTTD